MAATARVVVLMSPQEKAALEAKAAQAGPVSAAELVRRAVDAYDVGTDREAAELRQLLGVFQATHAETVRQLDRTDHALDRVLAGLAG